MADIPHKNYRALSGVRPFLLCGGIVRNGYFGQSLAEAVYDIFDALQNGSRIYHFSALGASKARNVLYNDYHVFKLGEIGGSGICYITFAITAFHVASLLRVPLYGVGVA